MQTEETPTFSPPHPPFPPLCSLACSGKRSRSKQGYVVSLGWSCVQLLEGLGWKGEEEEGREDRAWMR